MPINEASSIKDLSGKTVQFNSQQGPKTAHNYWNLARPHDLFSSCKLLQANTRKSWNFMTLGNVFTAWQETLSFSLFLTIISSLFSIFLLFFLLLLVSTIQPVYSSPFMFFLPLLDSTIQPVCSCSFSRCLSLTLCLFTRALSCSFSRCLSLILCLFTRALSCSFSRCLSLILRQRIDKTDFVLKLSSKFGHAISRHKNAG